ncbi:MAG TPA: hypothetical protein VGS61_00845, partial [Acidimicrobiales bacterium]|nr:hypothetical protein [Acidimicrobiales bacterium]
MTDPAERSPLVERAAWSLVWLAIVAAGVDAWGSWSAWPGVAVTAPLVVLLGLAGAAALWLARDDELVVMRRVGLGAAVAAVGLTDGIGIGARHAYATDSAAFNDVATHL